MTNNVDLNLSLTSQNYYDISFDSDGDFKKVAGFDTAILMTFTCERRASSSEVQEPQYRRGWLGNEINGYDNYEIGSKNWLLEQSRATEDTRNKAITYNQEATQWFIDDNHVKSINVKSNYDNNISLVVTIDFIRYNNQIMTKTYNVWQQTFVDGDV